jgi:hypothetical protein
MSELEAQWTSGHKHHFEEKHIRVENALRCLNLVKNDIDLSTVIDFGCGIGGWLRAAEILGAREIVGLEGEYIHKNETVIPKEKIITADLAEYDHDWKKHFTTAFTIEVAEHLPEASADRFCAALVNASNVIVFSAARVGQTGVGHINLQPLRYWVKKFWSLGYVPLEPFRPFIAGDTSIYWWLRQNLVMFVNYSTFVGQPNLHRFARPHADFDLLYHYNAG